MDIITKRHALCFLPPSSLMMKVVAGRTRGMRGRRELASGGVWGAASDGARWIV